MHVTWKLKLYIHYWATGVALLYKISLINLIYRRYYVLDIVITSLVCLSIGRCLGVIEVRSLAIQG